MDRKKELKQLIEDLSEQSEVGHKVQHLKCRLQIELDEILWFDFEEEEIEQSVREEFYMPQSHVRETA